MDTATITAAVLGAGGGGVLLALLQGYRDIRAGARQGQRETVDDLMRWRDDLDHQHRQCAKDRDYWRALAAQRGSQLYMVGVEPAEPDPVPPSERKP